MNRNVLIGMLVPATGLASIIALLSGERRTVSLQIWLACFVGAFAFAALVQLRDSAPVVAAPQRSILASSDDGSEVVVSRARRLRAIEGLVLRSRDNDRAFAQQLQPQLAELAHHFLRVNHGVDLARHPEQADIFLGDVAWLIESEPAARTPQLSELNRFLDRLQVGSHQGEAA